MRSYRDLLAADRVYDAWPLTETASPPINIVQTAPVGHTVSTSGAVTVTLANTPLASSTLIVICCGMSAGSGAWSGSTLSWTWDAAEDNEADISIGRAASDGTTTAFTFTEANPDASSADRWVILWEVSGLLASPVDHTTTATPTEPWAASLAANTNPNALEIFALGFEKSGATLTAPAVTNGFTLIAELSTDSGTFSVSLLLAYKIVTVQDTPSTSMSWTGSGGNKAAVGVSYKGTPSPTGVGINGGTVVGMTHNANPALGQTGIPTGEPESAVKYASASSQFSLTTTTVNIDPTAPPFSLECWVKTTESTGYQTFCTLRNSFTDNSGNCMLFGTDIANAGDITMFYTTAGDTASHITSTAHTYNDGAWHHVVGTCTAAGLVTLYVDGVLQTTGASQSASHGGSAYVILGSNWSSGGASQFFDGTVAWPACYSYALNADQVRRHYLAGRYGIFPRGGSGARRRRR